jgi:hypothetical protein
VDDHPILGKVFEEAFSNDKNLFFLDTYGEYVIRMTNDMGQIFINSFIYGVRQFLSEVEGYISNRLPFPTEK